jgi:hypothetical protein
VLTGTTDGEWFAAWLGFVALFHRSIECIHVDMDDFARPDRLDRRDLTLFRSAEPGSVGREAVREHGDQTVRSPLSSFSPRATILRVSSASGR